MLVIGIDIGGMSIKWGLVDEAGKVLATDSMVTIQREPQDITGEKLCNNLLGFLKAQNLTTKDIAGIGIGCPGIINSPEKTVTYANNLYWENFKLGELIEKKLGVKVEITNDANAAALGEIKFGAGKKYKNAIMLTLGTGVGGGIIVDGKLIEGNKGAGAELGHICLNFNSQIKCTCGRRGCFEVYASATALIRQTKEAMLANPKSKMWDMVGGDLDNVNGKLAWDARLLGDETAIEVVNNYITYLGEGVLNYCNIFRPEAIIFSGGIAKQGQVLIDLLTKYCKDHDYGYARTPEVKLLIAELGYESGIIGAASLVL